MVGVVASKYCPFHFIHSKRLLLAIINILENWTNVQRKSREMKKEIKTINEEGSWGLTGSCLIADCFFWTFSVVLTSVTCLMGIILR